MSDADEPEDYAMGVELTMNIVGYFDRVTGPEPKPRFRFPKDVALIVALDTHGATLCVNEPARIVIDTLVKTAKRFEIPSPTAMMLKVVLERYGIPYDEVQVSELDLPGAKFIVKGGAKA